MGLKQLVLAAFILVLMQLWGCNGCLEDERVALLQIQASFNISWYPFDKTGNCCDWTRIQCDAHTGRITHLKLFQIKEQEWGDWYLNVSLFLPFKQLTYLDLRFNRIIGCFQNEGFERLTESNKLNYLDLSGNNFNNNILSSLSGLSFLKSLNISYNNLKGSTNLGEIASLKNLEELRLRGNSINGFENLIELNKLEYLNLSYNNFNNNILPSLSGLSSLKSLYIGYNHLKGSIYLEELASLKSLKELELGGNKNISEFIASKDVRAPLNLNTIYLDDMTANGMPLLLKSLPSFSSLKTLSLGYNNLSEWTFYHDSQSFKSLENLYLDGSIVDDNFFRSLHMLFSLQSLSFRGGNGLDNLQGLCNLNPNHLQTLDLLGSNLHGRLPLCLSNFTSLQYLELSYNSLDGNLHSTSLGTLTNLQSLYLRGNNFSGTLPWWLANLTSLQDLDLSYNSLEGNLSSSPPTLITSIQYLFLEDNKFQIPISLVPFYNYSSLSNLGVRGNELYVEIESHNLIPKFQLEIINMGGIGCGGSFPRFLYNQHNLRTVHLWGNKMSGEFPHWLLENNTSLEELYLSNNSLTGTIRLPIHSHMYLSILDISSNCFSGHIPAKFGTYFPNLGNLDMSHNELNGSFPLSIGNMSLLEYFDLSNNYLSGDLPEVLNCSSLRVFDISENDIGGSLPIFSSSILEEVYLAKNNLHGSLFLAFNNSSSHLRILTLNHNSFIGIIPKWIGNLKSLNFLQLAHNYLEGEIPSEVCKLNELRFIDLSNNNLFGQIPPCVKSNHILDKDYGYIFGSIQFTTKSFSYSYEGIPLALFSGIDLSCNKLTGKIPHELGNLTKIRVLNLSHNSLRGSIPPTFSNLVEIESLDLSHNNLGGKIPSQLTQLKALSSFSVAYNNLSGRIPDFVYQFATFENTSYEGNPFLCGKPLSKSCEATVSPSPLLGALTNSEEEDDAFMDMEAFYVTFGVSYVMVLLGIVAVLYINPYWRRAWFYFIERKMTDCYYFIDDLFSS